MTYVDSNVLINAASGEASLMDRALAIIEDTNRTFLWSNYLKLEVVPKPIFNGYPNQVDFFLNFFGVAQFIPSSDALIEDAQELAAKYDLAPMDAIHIACAKSAHAAEFLTFENPCKPFFNLPAATLKITSLYETS